jgi:hypothetical protein
MIPSQDGMTVARADGAGTCDFAALLNLGDIVNPCFSSFAWSGFVSKFS